jgi:hypothetical protein
MKGERPFLDLLAPLLVAEGSLRGKRFRGGDLNLTHLALVRWLRGKRGKRFASG